MGPKEKIWPSVTVRTYTASPLSGGKISWLLRKVWMAEPELVHAAGAYHHGCTSWRSALHPCSDRGEHRRWAALPKWFPSVKQSKCIFPQPAISQNSSVWSLEERGFHPLACGFAVIVSSELSPESFRVSSERLCPSGLAGMWALFWGWCNWALFPCFCCCVC